jgi:hypothetical protein
VIARLLSALAVLAALAGGLWFWAGVVAPGYWSSIALGAAWFVAVSAAAGRLGRARPALRPVLRGTFLAATALTLAAFWWTSIRETEVDEPLGNGVPASELPAGQRPDLDDLLAPQP